jgi:hypothetical protein
MRNGIVVSAALALVACKGNADGDKRPASGGASVAGAASGSSGSGNGSGSGSGNGSAAVEEREAAEALPQTEAVGPTWKVNAGFGDTPSIFDVDAAKLETLGLEVVDAHGASVFRKTGFAAIAGQASPPRQCEELRVVAAVESWGEASGARVSLFCVNGEDFKTVSETAILLEIRGKPDFVGVLWAGEADETTNEMDACITSSEVKFSVAGQTLTQRITETVERGEGAPRTCKKRKKHHTVKVTIPRT